MTRYIIRDLIIYLAWCVTELMHGRNPSNGKTDDERIQELVDKYIPGATIWKVPPMRSDEEDECSGCPGNTPGNDGCFSYWVWRDEHQEGNW